MPRKRPRVVPRLVFSASFIGVLPACAVQACGGQTSTKDGGSDAAQDVFVGVFCNFCDASVAVIGFDADADSPTEASDGANDAPADAPEGG